MLMREERIPMKMLHPKLEGKQPRETPRTTWIKQIRKDVEMRVELERNKRKQEVGE